MQTRHIVSFGAGVALAIAATAWAQSGYPTRPRFNSVGIGVTAPTTNGAAVLSSTTPTLALYDSDAAADEKSWMQRSASGFFILSTATDAAPLTAFNNALSIDRTGTTLGAMTVAPLTTFTGIGSSVSPSVTFASTLPVLELNETDAAANNGRWQFFAGTEQLVLRTINDATSASENILVAHRTAETIDSITFPRVEISHATLPALQLIQDTEINWARASSAAVELYGGTGNAARLQSNDGAHLFVLASAGGITYDGVDVTPSTGTFTATYNDGCTTSPTQSVRWTKIGNLVTMTAAAAISCTSDTTIFNSVSTDVPAAIRPTTSSVYSAGFGASNNTASATAQIEIAGGQLVINRCGAVTGTCDGGAWSNAGTKGLDAWTLSYVL